MLLPRRICEAALSGYRLSDYLPARLGFLQATRELSAIQEITEEKAMYDSREKAVLDIESNLIDAREEGIERGIEKGIERGKTLGELLGKIRLLQELLGEEVSRKEELEIQPPELLTSKIEALQAKLTKRLS